MSSMLSEKRHSIIEIDFEKQALPAFKQNEKNKSTY